MRIAGEFSFNDGKKVIGEKFPDLLREIETAIRSVKASDHKKKVSREKTMKGRILFDPRSLNNGFKKRLYKLGWETVRVRCEYPKRYYRSDYAPKPGSKGAFREMDFVKNKLGVEVQFGKYAFMVYNVCAKMTIFKNLGHITCGVEIVPVKKFADDMSTGVSYFEQFVWDLEARGVSDIDIPVLILGIDS